MSLDLLCLDADDTLWHNMNHFDAAESAFFAMMAPFADEPVARSRLEATSSANLRLYGYGAKSFTLSMIETATQLCGNALTGDTITGWRDGRGIPIGMLKQERWLPPSSARRQPFPSADRLHNRPFNR